MAEAGLLAGLELVVRLVGVLVHVLQEVRSQGRRGWMRKIGVDHNTHHPPTQSNYTQIYTPTDKPVCDQALYWAYCPTVKAPSCLKVRLARLVLRRVLIERSLWEIPKTLREEMT